MQQHPDTCDSLDAYGAPVCSWVISGKGSPLVPALCLPAWTSPQRGEAGGGRCRWRPGSGEGTAHAVPPSNLSCATAWAQRTSRFPPLGGGNGHEGGSFQEIALEVRSAPRAGHFVPPSGLEQP